MSRLTAPLALGQTTTRAVDSRRPAGRREPCDATSPRAGHTRGGRRRQGLHHRRERRRQGRRRAIHSRPLVARGAAVRRRQLRRHRRHVCSRPSSSGTRAAASPAPIATASGRLEAAHRGTIFLDEIAEMSLQMQAHLLRFLESGEIQPVGSAGGPIRVDVRIISATNRDLEQLVATGAFRSDLLYRIKVVHIHVPPLRDRKEDLPTLIEAAATRTGRQIRFTESALQALTRYRWPGNVRELQNVIEQAAWMSESPGRRRPGSSGDRQAGLNRRPDAAARAAPAPRRRPLHHARRRPLHVLGTHPPAAAQA